MKILKKITLLILILSCCFSLHAGHKKYNNSCKPNYNGPDLRQQKQQMHQLEKQFKNMNIGKPKKMSQLEQLEKLFQKMSIDEVDQDEKQTPLSIRKFSYSQKTILALLTIVLIVATVTAKHNQKIIPHKIPHFAWNVSKFAWDISIITAESLPSGTEVFCKIHPLYIVECCACKSKTDCNCLSFNSDGIIGDEASGSVNTTEIYQEIYTDFSTKEKSFDIAKEARCPKYAAKLSYANGTVELFATYGNDLFKDLSISKNQVNGLKISCNLVNSSIEKKDFPILFNTIRILANKFKFSNNSIDIKIYNDMICAPFLYGALSPFIFASYYGYDDTEQCSCRWLDRNCGEMTLNLPSSYLVLLSDEMLVNVFAHELWHVNQGIRWCYGIARIQLSPEGNNSETEADMASFLVTGKPYLAVWFGRDLKSNEIENLPTITNKNVFEKLKEHNPWDPEHPATKPRIAFLVTMYKHYEKVRNFLIMEELKRKEL